MKPKMVRLNRLLAGCVETKNYTIFYLFPNLKLHFFLGKPNPENSYPLFFFPLQPSLTLSAFVFSDFFFSHSFSFSLFGFGIWWSPFSLTHLCLSLLFLLALRYYFEQMNELQRTRTEEHLIFSHL